MRAKTLCAHPGCSAIVPRGRCSAHARPAFQGAGKGRSFIPGWAGLRSTVLARDPSCRICGVHRSTVCDHIIPLSEGGAQNDMGNLQGICESCSRAKSGAEGARARRRRVVADAA